MRIINPGKKPNEEREKTCGYCKCKFAYTKNDVESDRDGNFVKCPTCKKLLAV